MPNTNRVDISTNMPSVFNQVQTLRDALLPLRSSKKIALVPTMGNLHAGHVSLVEIAKQNADVVVVSIFVNPTQFGEGEDFDSYPRTLDADIEKLTQAGADFVFAPEVTEMYPDFPTFPTTQVLLGELTTYLCGASRPGHFDGVGLVVSKLFNIVTPDVAVFGKKDYQQLALINQLVNELSYPIQIIKAPIIRAEDGLALSSRNQYLSEEERKLAPELNKTITDLANKLVRGEHVLLGEGSIGDMIARACQHLNAIGFEVDYLQVRTQQLKDVTVEDNDLVILVAAWLGGARLLDNQEVVVDI